MDTVAVWVDTACNWNVLLIFFFLSSCAEFHYTVECYTSFVSIFVVVVSLYISLFLCMPKWLVANIFYISWTVKCFICALNSHYIPISTNWCSLRSVCLKLCLFCFGLYFYCFFFFLCSIWRVWWSSSRWPRRVWPMCLIDMCVCQLEIAFCPFYRHRTHTFYSPTCLFFVLFAKFMALCAVHTNRMFQFDHLRSYRMWVQTCQRAIYIDNNNWDLSLVHIFGPDIRYESWIFICAVGIVST